MQDLDLKSHPKDCIYEEQILCKYQLQEKNPLLPAAGVDKWEPNPQPSSRKSDVCATLSQASCCFVIVPKSKWNY